MSTILVVDDDPDLRALLLHQLTRAGHDVVLAEDGRAAEDAVRTRTADLIIADINMPRMTGDAFVAALREDPSLPSIPVIYLTGLEQNAELAIKTLGYPVLGKPVVEKDLLAMVARQLPRPAASPAA